MILELSDPLKVLVNTPIPVFLKQVKTLNFAQKSIMRNIILVVAVILFNLNTHAHAIWIETSATGKTGKSQNVRVYFGEYSENERDSAGHWFSDLGQFKLWVTAPDGTKTELLTKPDGNAFSVNYIPKTKGVHVLSIDHLVGDVYYESLIHYYALASVVVNEDAVTGSENLSKATGFAVELALEKSSKVGEQVEVDLFYNQKAPVEATFSVQPPLGWTKEFELNEKGHTVFKPYLEGKYMLEGIYTDKTPGKHNEKGYTAVWHCVTYCIDVKK